MAIRIQGDMSNPVKLIRAKYGLSQGRLSSLTGIPVKTISSWEMDNASARRPPDWLPPLLDAALSTMVPASGSTPAGSTDSQ